MHCCNINKSRRGGFLFGSPGKVGQLAADNSTTVTVTLLQRGTFSVIPGRPGFPGIKKSISEFPGMERPRWE